MADLSAATTPDAINGALAITVIGFLIRAIVGWFKERQDKSEQDLDDRVTKAVFDHELHLMRERVDDKFQNLLGKINDLTVIEREHAKLDKDFRHDKFDAFQQTQANRHGLIERRLDKLDDKQEQSQEDRTVIRNKIDKLCERVDRLDRRIFKIDGDDHGRLR